MRRVLVIAAVMALAFAYAFGLIPLIGFVMLLAAVLTFAWSAGWLR